MMDTSKFKYYPSIDDPDFVEKIYNKQEFFRYKSKPLQILDIDEREQEFEKKCSGAAFELQSFQKIVKNFISPSTIYNSLLMLWDVGVGKSCGGIQIAENFKEYINKNGRKIFIVTKKSAVKQISDEIYSFDKEKNELEHNIELGSTQCTADTYVMAELKTDRENQISKKISESYFKDKNKKIKAFSHDEFASFIASQEAAYPTMSLSDIFKESIIIIDEAHAIHETVAKNDDEVESNIENVDASSISNFKHVDNLEDFDETAQKRHSKNYLYQMLTDPEKKILGKNTKLVLMTATPMENYFYDLIYLVNILRANENLPLLTHKDLFPNGTEMIAQETEEAIINYTRGFVSHVSSINQVTFARLVYPPDTYQPFATEPSLNFLERAPMSVQQFKAWWNIKRSGKSDFYSSELRVSTIAFYDNKTHMVLNFNDFYKEESISGKRKYSLKKGMHDLFSLDNIGDYSAKFLKIYNNLVHGKHFVYFQYVTDGALSFSLFLERNGFKHVLIKDNTVVMHNKDGSYPDDACLLKYTPHDNSRCSICGNIRAAEHKGHNFIQALYYLMTGRDQNAQNFGKFKEQFNSDQNMHGQLIQVFVGSPKSGIAINLFHIKHIHIAGPWFNMTSIYQAIGRAHRQCGHRHLSYKDREIVVHQYAASSCEPTAENFKFLKDNNLLNPTTEKVIFSINTTDEAIYRLALKKDVNVKHIERILKIGAIDCPLNKNMNISLDSSKDYTRQCDYMKCNYTCAYEPTSDITIVDFDTYNETFDEIDIQRIIKRVKDIFRQYVAMTYAEINNILRTQYLEIDELPDLDMLLYEALDQMVGNTPMRTPILLNNGIEMGYLINVQQYLYVFQPVRYKDKTIPVEYRQLTAKEQNDTIDISNIILEDPENTVESSSTIVGVLKSPKEEDIDLTLTEEDIAEYFDTDDGEIVHKIFTIIDVIQKILPDFWDNFISFCREIKSNDIYVIINEFERITNIEFKTYLVALSILLNGIVSDVFYAINKHMEKFKIIEKNLIIIMIFDITNKRWKFSQINKSNLNTEFVGDLTSSDYKDKLLQQYRRLYRLEPLNHYAFFGLLKAGQDAVFKIMKIMEDGKMESTDGRACVTINKNDMVDIIKHMFTEVVEKDSLKLIKPEIEKETFTKISSELKRIMEKKSSVAMKCGILVYILRVMDHHRILNHNWFMYKT